MPLTYDRRDERARPEKIAVTGEHFAVPKPLYSQVRDRLASQISSGQWPPGSTLPNEMVLAQNFGVSIGTIRRAVEGLEDLGIVRRRQGRGTFVAGPGQPAISDRYRRLHDAQGEMLQSTQTLLSFRARPASPEEASLFRLTGEVEVIDVRHAILVETVPIGIEQSVLADVSPDGIEANLEKGLDLYALLSEVGLMVIRAEDAVSAVIADDADAVALPIAPGAPLLQISRQAFTIGDRLVELRVSRYLASQVRYQSTAA
jgi:GntR family transcriptional regulator